jgi:predicted nucleic acid-binding protein
MKAVVDASVAAKWVIEEDRSDKAVLLLEYEQLHAPDHWLAEAVNVVWSKVYKGDLDASDAEERMAVLSRSPVIVTAISTLMPAAFAISVDHSITVYDALYVALACKRRMPFITDDQNLIRRLSGTQLSSHVIPLSVLTRLRGFDPGNRDISPKSVR